MSMVMVVVRTAQTGRKVMQGGVVVVSLAGVVFVVVWASQLSRLFCLGPGLQFLRM